MRKNRKKSSLSLFEKKHHPHSRRRVLPHLLDGGDRGVVGLVGVVRVDRLFFPDQLGQKPGRLLLPGLGGPGDQAQPCAVPDAQLRLPQAVLVRDGLPVGLGVGRGALLEGAQELRGLERGVGVGELGGLARGRRGGGGRRGRGDGIVEGRYRDGLEAQGGCGGNGSGAEWSEWSE